MAVGADESGLTKTPGNFNTENGCILNKIFFAPEYAVFGMLRKWLAVRYLKCIDKNRHAFCA